jgi:hypothetical protein
MDIVSCDGWMTAHGVVSLTTEPGHIKKALTKYVVQRRLFLCNMLHLIRCPLNGNLNGGLGAIVNSIRSNRPTAQPNG